MLLVWLEFIFLLGHTPLFSGPRFFLLCVALLIPLVSAQTDTDRFFLFSSSWLLGHGHFRNS
jgi:hypothetical protein